MRQLEQHQQRQDLFQQQLQWFEDLRVQQEQRSWGRQREQQLRHVLQQHVTMQKCVVGARATELDALKRRASNREFTRSQKLREAAEVFLPRRLTNAQLKDHQRLVTQRRNEGARLQSLHHDLEEAVTLRQASWLIECKRESRELDVSEQAVREASGTPPPLRLRDG